MRLCIVGHEVKARADIRNYSGAWCFYLPRELRALGHEVFFLPADADPAQASEIRVDHVIGIGPSLTKLPALSLRMLRRRTRGKVTQVRDRGHRHVCGIADVTFCVTLAVDPRAIAIGWAADADLFQPDQDDVLTILIDHPNYGRGEPRPDLSAVVLAEVAKLAEAKPCRVLRLVDGGAETIDPATATVPVFTRQHIPLEQIVPVYAKAHVFIVTHPESVGLTVLETALCGSLAVVPAGFIAPDLLRTVRHAPFTARMDWDALLSTLDPPASRAFAMRNTWQSVAGRLSSDLQKMLHP